MLHKLPKSITKANGPIAAKPWNFNTAYLNTHSKAVERTHYQIKLNKYFTRLYAGGFLSQNTSAETYHKKVKNKQVSLHIRISTIAIDITSQKRFLNIEVCVIQQFTYVSSVISLVETSFL